MNPEGGSGFETVLTVVSNPEGGSGFKTILTVSHIWLLSSTLKTSSFLHSMALCRGVHPLISCESGLAWYSSSRLAICAMESQGQGASFIITEETLVRALGEGRGEGEVERGMRERWIKER